MTDNIGNLFLDLKKIDRETYNKINDKIGIPTICWENVFSNDKRSSKYDIKMGQYIVDILQGELQRAIEREEKWVLEQSFTPWFSQDYRYKASIYFNRIVKQTSSSNAVLALLETYIKAIKIF